MTSILDHERSKTTDDQGHRTSNVVNLKNPKNRKMNNNHSISDILDGDSPIELEAEPLPIGPAKENDFLETLPKIDNEGVIPNNAGDMASFATLASTAISGFDRDSGLRTGTFSEPQEPSTSLAWTAPDKNHELISHALRKWIIIILVAAAFVVFFWQGSILSAITFFALALVTSMHFWREAVYHKYQIHPHGIAIGDRFYHYHDLDSFWIHYHPEGHHELSLCTGNLINHYIKIPLGDRDPFEVRDALMMYLPEERHEEGLEDWLRRRLGL